MDFHKRFYTSPRQFLGEVVYLARHARDIRKARSRGVISPAFRERLMLAVTAVYGCRYCSYIHTREALKGGIEEEEAALLLSGSLESCPPEEAMAVLYAQHWAESDANPDADALRRLEEAYGAEKARAIHLTLRMVRVGNLTGNLWDYVLYTLSRGRWGT